MAEDQSPDVVARHATATAVWARHVHSRPVLRRIRVDDHVAWVAIDDLGVCAIAPDRRTLSELVGPARDR